MEATIRRRSTATPITKVWNLAKELDDSQKLELVSILIDSLKPAVAPPIMRRYTMDEINAMLDEAEAEIAAGGGIPHEEVMREWDEEIARWEQEDMEMAKAR